MLCIAIPLSFSLSSPLSYLAQLNALLCDSQWSSLCLLPSNWGFLLYENILYFAQSKHRNHRHDFTNTKPNTESPMSVFCPRFWGTCIPYQAFKKPSPLPAVRFPSKIYSGYHVKNICVSEQQVQTHPSEQHSQLPWNIPRTRN